MSDYPLIFLRQLKELVGIEDSYTEQDSRLRLAINSATKTIENLVGRKLSKNVYTDYMSSKRNFFSQWDIYGHSDTGTYSEYKHVPLYLKQFPVDVSEPFEVYYDTNMKFEADTLLDENSYILDAERGVLYLKKAVGDFKRSIKVVYTAGYEATVDTDGGVVENLSAIPPQEYALANSLPADLVQAAIWQAMLVYEKQYSANINVKWSRGEGSTNSVGYTNLYAVSPEAMAVCAGYKRRFFSAI